MFLGSDLCCCADQTVLSVFGSFGIDGVHLGGFHAMQCLWETLTGKHPSAPDATRAIPRACMDYFAAHLATHAAVLQRRAVLNGNAPLSQDRARELALADAAGHCARYYADPITIFRRLLKHFLIPYDKVNHVQYGRVITERTWDAFWCLMTHVMGTRPRLSARNFNCLSTPIELFHNGGLFLVKRELDLEKGTSQLVKSCGTDSEIEGLHRAAGHDWSPTRALESAFRWRRR